MQPDRLDLDVDVHEFACVYTFQGVPRGRVVPGAHGRGRQTKAQAQEKEEAESKRNRVAERYNRLHLRCFACARLVTTGFNHNFVVLAQLLFYRFSSARSTSSDTVV
jgi:hypothetical protein